MKIGVIAGTPVDTAMGAEYVRRSGHTAIERPCSATPQEQMLLQDLHRDQLTDRVIALCDEMTAEGAEGILMYCNSMAAAVDAEYVRGAIRSRKLVTPFDVYRESALQYSRLAVVAATSQSLGAIEKIIAEQNPACVSFGVSLLPLVIGIETGRPPMEIFASCGIEHFLRGFEILGAEALLLGCTHFPYIEGPVRKCFHGDVIEPSRRMLELLEG